MYRIVTDPIDIEALSRAVARPGAGAIVTFAGTTRDETDGRSVRSLAYDAYPEMAVAEIGRIGGRARERFPIQEIAIHHRIGTLGIGEVSVGIAVSSAHRPAAFEACRFAIEEVKRHVPIWKKEVFADGTEEWRHPGEPC